VRLLIALVGTVGLGAILLALLILAHLTQKWEAVARSNSYYRLFYVAAALVGVASLVRVVRMGHLSPVVGPSIPSAQVLLYEPQSWFYLCFYYIPLATGLTISLWLTWRNWGWLLREQDS